MKPYTSWVIETEWSRNSQPPGLDVDRLARLELLLEHVAVAVDPDDALVVAGEELIDPEAAAVEHVREPLDPAVVVLDVAGRGEELVLAHDDALAGAAGAGRRCGPARRG